jgi:hypothetical protein
VVQEKPKDVADTANRLNLNHHDMFASEQSRGYIQLNDVIIFKNAVTDLLRSGHAETPAGVLVAMKSIVIATRNISDAVEVFEGQATSENAERSSVLRDVMSRHLTELMTAAKNKATGIQSLGMEAFEGAAEALVDTMTSMIALVKIIMPLASNGPMAITSAVSSPQSQAVLAQSTRSASQSELARAPARKASVDQSTRKPSVDQSTRKPSVDPSVPDYEPAELKARTHGTSRLTPGVFGTTD